VAPPPDATFGEAPDGTRLYVAIDGEGSRGVVWLVVGPEVGSAPLYPRLCTALRGAGLAVAVLHPRGAGYSDGLRGDIADYASFLGDYRWFAGDLARRFPGLPLFLIGHSAGAALALEVAARTETPLAGVVLVNPAYKLITSQGMGPTLGDYVRYAANTVLRPSALTADMNARPEAVADPDDRAEALAMQGDPIVVRYFSMRYLFAQRRVMQRCVENARALGAPLLLVEGARDALVDRAGSAEIFEAASSADKQRLPSPGAHGSSAVESVVEPLVEWIVARARAS
jgi:alpha-beta hydrolase superfamily lysophospholipase